MHHDYYLVEPVTLVIITMDKYQKIEKLGEGKEKPKTALIIINFMIKELMELFTKRVIKKLMGSLH